MNGLNLQTKIFQFMVRRSSQKNRWTMMQEQFIGEPKSYL